MRPAAGRIPVPSWRRRRPAAAPCGPFSLRPCSQCLRPGRQADLAEAETVTPSICGLVRSAHLSLTVSRRLSALRPHLCPLAGLCVPGFVFSGRVLYFLALFCICTFNYVSSGQVLYPLVEFRILWPESASSGQILHPLARFCILWPGSASSGRVLRPLAGICILR